MDSIQTIILAAGNGKRMKSALPKALLPFRGEAMVSRVVRAVENAGFKIKPIVVISNTTGEQIKKILGNRSNYAIQSEQLGTGHAVSSSKDFVSKQAKHILVLYSDHPLVKSKTIKLVANFHIKHQSPITMAIVKVPNFEDWRLGLHDFGRVKRDKKTGKIIGIVEKKDANEKELQIKEVNPSYFCFEVKWLFSNLPKLQNINVQKEYYLTDMVKIASDANIIINSIQIEPEEAMGANTPEQLALLEKLAENSKL
jgi:bifunctional UDP-N-acetylglucosamine pyrophosphorylase/glucosamine-1-phosphate N-acetyltransferase